MLYKQCPQIQFSDSALDEVIRQTSGQPWLVNRIGAWCVQNLEKNSVVSASNILEVCW